MIGGRARRAARTRHAGRGVRGDARFVADVRGLQPDEPDGDHAVGVYMLDHLSEHAAAPCLEHAIAAARRKGDKVTYDLKTSRTHPTAVGTSEFADAVIEEMNDDRNRPSEGRGHRRGRQIGYALLFRIASGQLLGPQPPIALELLEIPLAYPAAEGTTLELTDCAFPLLAPSIIYDRSGTGVATG